METINSSVVENTTVKHSRFRKYFAFATMLYSFGKVMGIRNLFSFAKSNVAESSIGGLAVAIIVAVIIIVIAVALIPTVFSSVYAANNNATLVSKYSSAFAIVNLIPLIFAAVVVVVVLVLGFEKMGKRE